MNTAAHRSEVQKIIDDLDEAVETLLERGAFVGATMSPVRTALVRLRDEPAGGNENRNA